MSKQQSVKNINRFFIADKTTGSLWLVYLDANNQLYVLQMRNRQRGSNLGLLLLALAGFPAGT